MTLDRRTTPAVSGACGLFRGQRFNLADRLVSATLGTTTETYTWSGDGMVGTLVVERP